MIISVKHRVADPDPGGSGSRSHKFVRNCSFSSKNKFLNENRIANPDPDPGGSGIFSAPGSGSGSVKMF